MRGRSLILLVFAIVLSGVVSASYMDFIVDVTFSNAEITGQLTAGNICFNNDCISSWDDLNSILSIPVELPACGDRNYLIYNGTSSTWTCSAQTSGELVIPIYNSNPADLSDGEIWLIQ